jgi:hypothetical protein
MSRVRKKLWAEARKSTWLSELSGVDAAVIRQGCRVKMCHDNALQALEAARHAERTFGEVQVAYTCPVCGFIHLGNPISVLVLSSEFDEAVTYKKRHDSCWHIMILGQTLTNVSKEATAIWQVKTLKRLLAEALGKMLTEMCPEITMPKLDPGVQGREK